MNISTEILEKYHLTNRELFDTDLDFYKEFLKCTDHIPNKIIEAQATGKTLEDFTEILTYRQQARDEINRLEAAEE